MDDYKPQPYEYLYKPWSYQITGPSGSVEWVQLLDDASIMIQQKILTYEHILTQHYSRVLGKVQALSKMADRKNLEYEFELDYKSERIRIEIDQDNQS